MDQEDGYLWDLEFWEHEPGRSWAADEYGGLPREILAMVARRQRNVLQKRTFEQLRKSGDLKNVQKLPYLEITIPKNEIRIFGVIENTNNPPIFMALYVFHKKEQKIKQRDIELALQRFKIYKNKNGL